MNDLLIKLLSAWGIPKREALHQYALQCIHKDMAPTQDEYGCAEAVTTIIHSIFPSFLPKELSTTAVYKALKSSTRFTIIPLTQAKAGDIIVSPTGYGNGKIKNGHIGIFTTQGRIMSNDSATGKWMPNYNIGAWVARYCEVGGYPAYVFRILY